MARTSSPTSLARWLALGAGRVPPAPTPADAPRATEEAAVESGSPDGDAPRAPAAQAPQEPPAAVDPAALLASLEKALSDKLPPPAVAALTAPLRQAVASPAARDAAGLAKCLDQLEELMEALLLVPAPPRNGPRA
ncbi:hypothetical protein [Polyangium aurulentum]|uniref:hypothetical protein n=1 Tax=Polyangium aurulentum TaxID=2567896 RepID=UPI0010ADF288|nr:hypothetical protein [Polyangium aurulentum]UQA56290.1 hypothetical protein E8A73_033980 [Polyangium aurulentum]